MKVIKEDEFLKDFNERVLIPLQKTCSLLNIRPHINYMEEDFSTILNIVLFYTGYYDIENDDLMVEIYNFQMDIATNKLKDFYEDFVKKIFNENLTENDDITFFRVSDMNYNTAIFFGGDNFDGFNITYTDE